MKTEDNVEVHSEDYKTKITINDAQRKDTGLYKIIAENEVGRDEAEVEFVVLGLFSFDFSDLILFNFLMMLLLLYFKT